MLSLSFQARIFTNYHSGQDCTNGRKYRYSIQYNPPCIGSYMDYTPAYAGRLLGVGAAVGYEFAIHSTQ